jgi:3-methyladenine DNA glycosylase AlkD
MEPVDEETEALLREAGAVAARGTPALRALRRARSKAWATRPAAFILGVALGLSRRRRHRWVGYELVRHHEPAFAALDDESLSDLAAGLDSWDSVDGFARILSGPAWVRGRASDGLIDAWSRSPDRWLRRAALVSTVALNRPADGGSGDAARTLAICARSAGDRDDMVEKALSWALRALVAHDAQAVAGFLAERESQIAARVRRETGNKLRTGRKRPRPVG